MGEIMWEHELGFWGLRMERGIINWLNNCNDYFANGGILIFFSLADFLCKSDVNVSSIIVIYIITP